MLRNFLTINFILRLTEFHGICFQWSFPDMNIRPDINLSHQEFVLELNVLDANDVTSLEAFDARMLRPLLQLCIPVQHLCQNLEV